MRLVNLHLELKASHNHMITGLKNRLFPDSFAVYDGTVCASKVPQSNRKVINGEYTMMPTDQFTVGPELAILLTTYQELLAVQSNYLTGMFSANDVQLDVNHSLGCSSG